MNYDDILEELGELGPWQILHIVLLWLPAAAAGIFVLTFSFSGLEPKGFRCPISQCEDPNNTTYSAIDEDWLFPKYSDTYDYEYCNPYKSNYSAINFENCTDNDFTK